LGPVVAIGNPGETLPPLGACREYHKNDAWQGRILELAAKAGLIVVILGTSPSIRWEIQQIARRRWLDKTIFLCPGVSNSDLRTRLNLLCETLHLPDEVRRRLNASVPADEFIGLVFSPAEEIYVIRSSRRFVRTDGIAACLAHYFRQIHLQGALPQPDDAVDQVLEDARPELQLKHEEQERVVAEWLAEALCYRDAKDHAKALPLLQKAAGAGNAKAMNLIGYMYWASEGVGRDYTEARHWYQKATDAGNAAAMLNLGVLYAKGNGVAKDCIKAQEWFQKAADAGNPEAMYNLGVLYAKGKGVAKDYIKAQEWFQKAADAGKPEAMYNLGVLHRVGRGGTQDDTQACQWYQKAADAGFPQAMFQLALVYREGRGVAKDYAKTKEWLLKAADAGYFPAKIRIERMAKLIERR
jgi:TPR repeat protein